MTIITCEHNHFGSPCWQCLENKVEKLEKQKKLLRDSLEMIAETMAENKRHQTAAAINNVLRLTE